MRNDEVSELVSKRPIAAVIAVVIREGLVLLVKRANPPDAGLWGFPGGKIEFGEMLGDAAVRELMEETGIKATAGKVLTTVDAFDVGESRSVREHYILVAISCTWISGSPHAADDALEARWFCLSTLESSTLPMSSGVVELALQADSLIC